MAEHTIYEEYRENLQALREEFPFLTETVFGYSYIGREIPALQLGEGAHRLLYVGGVTGIPFTTALLMRFARDYADAVQNRRRIAGIDISYLYNTRTITLVPLLNPDGAVLRSCGDDGMNPLIDRLRTMADDSFTGWETNGRGVDLRCNYDSQFDVCMAQARGVGGAGFPGMHPESEPECAAVCHYLRAAPVLDLGLLFLDGKPGARGHIAWNNGGSADYRTRTIAQILSGHSGYALDDTLIPGSLKDWYRSRNAGPLFEITCVRECEAPSNAFIALRYGQLQKMLFHGAVL